MVFCDAKPFVQAKLWRRVCVHLLFSKDQDKKYRRNVALKYTDATEYAYKVFYASEEIEGMNNLHTLNAHPGEELEIPALLYRALKAFDDANNRFLYYAPIYAVYQEMFGCENDSDAEKLDPAKNEQIKAYFNKMIALVSDPSNVRIEFSEGNVVKLVVSDEYKAAFGDRTPVYIDFFWTKMPLRSIISPTRCLAKAMTRVSFQVMTGSLAI